jgi:hypothetical protein
VLVAGAALIAGGLRGLGEDSPEKAIYSIAHGLEHDDRDEVCGRVVSELDLPAALGRSLGLSTEDQPDGDAGAPMDCGRLFADERLAEALGLDDPRVAAVGRIDVEPVAGFDGAARATVGARGGSRRSLALVRRNGVWKLVLGGSPGLHGR